MPETYYERLGVDEDATTAEIEAAYRDRLLETHPDVSDEPRASDRTQQLIEAKEALTDEQERARYDRLGHETFVEHHATFVEPTTEDVEAASPTGNDAGFGAGGDATAEYWDVDDGPASGPDPAGGTARTTPRDVSDAVTRDEIHAQPWRAGKDGVGRVYTADRSNLSSRLFPPGKSLVLLAGAFFLVPVMLWASVEPAFPLPVNLVVGACFLLLVGFLASMPEVGVVVFGGWTVLLPAVATGWFGMDLLSFVGGVVVGGTVLPLGLCLLVLVALRE